MKAEYGRLTTFLYHRVSPVGCERMEFLRQEYIRLGQKLIDLCPDSRTRELSLTALEESCMRAIQSIALVEGTTEETQYEKIT